VKQYAYSPGLGRNIEVTTHEPRCSKPNLKASSAPSGFKAQWVKKPLFWIGALRRSRSIHTRDLADIILAETFKAGRKDYSADEIVLSSDVVPSITRKYRVKAARELASFGLITIRCDSRRALRVALTEKTLSALSRQKSTV
jgi:hypothetical protein